MSLSVAIVAMDEEANIGRTLASVRWVDEIVLVDSGSKDRTREIAHEHGARVVEEPWRGYVAQKQYAVELRTKDWVLLLDADEDGSPELAGSQGRRSLSVADIVLRPLATFFYNYVVRLGFLDGREGLLLHLYHAVYVSWKYAKAWETARIKSH